MLSAIVLCDGQLQRKEDLIRLHDGVGRRSVSLDDCARLASAFFASIAKLAALCAVAFVSCGASTANASWADVSDDEKASLYRAVEICGRMTKRPMGLDLDKRVLCFDGQIMAGLDVSIAERLEDGGLFVVRSFGGNPTSAINLAEVLRERHATVVVYDYCFSACASFLLVASAKAVVLKRTLVAWHHRVGPHLCPSLEKAKDNGPRRLEKTLCPDAPAKYQRADKYSKELFEWFFSKRAATALFENPPQSIVVRRILQNKFGEKGEYPANLMWTWNPRYYASHLKTKITYEAYPESQDEVDALARWLPVRVIYDP